MSSNNLFIVVDAIPYCDAFENDIGGGPTADGPAAGAYVYDVGGLSHTALTGTCVTNDALLAIFIA